MGNFYHDDQVDRGFCDFRNDQSRPITLNKLYYVVLRVKVGHSVWYHHTAMAIDGDLPYHIDALKFVVRLDLKWRKADLTCVFARNFITQDTAVLNSTVQLGIIKELNARIAKGAMFSDKVERFLVTGFAGRDKISLLEVSASDAMDAVKEAVNVCSEQLNDAFQPMDVIAVSPVMPEILAKFEQCAPQLLALIRKRCKTK